MKTKRIFQVIAFLMLLAIAGRSGGLMQLRKTTIAAMKAYSGALLSDGDLCQIILPGNITVNYRLDASSGATDDGYFVVSPTTTPGSKRWILLDSSKVKIGLFGNNLATALTAISTREVTLQWDSNIALAADANCPETLDIDVVNGGVIAFGNYNLVVHGDFICPPKHKAFSYTGTGRITGLTCEVTPQMWGAVADDAIDDHLAIQYAIDANTSIVHFPKGTYFVSEVCYVYRDNLFLNGDGVNSSIIKRTDGSIDPNYGTGLDGEGAVLKIGTFTYRYQNIKVQNLTIDGNYQGQNLNQPETSQGFGIFIRSVDGFNIENCSVHDCVLTGVYFGSCSKTLTTKCKIYNNGNGGAVVSSKNGMSYHGYIDPNHDTKIPDHLILANDIYDNNDAGIMYGGVYDLSIIDNTIKNNSAAGIEGDSGYSTTNLNVPRNVIISNNYLKDNGDSISLSAGNENDYVITNNQILDSKKEAIYVVQSSGGNAIITGNIIENYMLDQNSTVRHGVIIGIDNLNWDNIFYQTQTPASTVSSYAMSLIRVKTAKIKGIFDRVQRGISIILNSADQVFDTELIEISASFNDMPNTPIILNKTIGTGYHLKQLNINNSNFHNIGTTSKTECIILKNTGLVDNVRIQNCTQNDQRDPNYTSCAVYQDANTTIGQLDLINNDFNNTIYDPISLNGMVNYVQRSGKYKPGTMYFDPNIGIGKSPQYAFDVNGQINIDNNNLTTSFDSSTGGSVRVGRSGTSPAIVFFTNTSGYRYNVQAEENGLNFYVDANIDNSAIRMRINTDGTIYNLQDYNGNSTAWLYQNPLLADDGIITLPADTIGFGHVICNAEHFTFYVQTDGTVSIEGASTNTAATDTDTDLCIYDGGTAAIIKNRLGTTGNILIKYWYH